MLTVEKSNIVLEGNGFTFTGSHGIKLTKVENVTIKDLTLETHYLHLFLDHSKNCVIQNVTSNFDFRSIQLRQQLNLQLHRHLQS